MDDKKIIEAVGKLLHKLENDNPFDNENNSDYSDPPIFIGDSKGGHRVWAGNNLTECIEDIHEYTRELRKRLDKIKDDIIEAERVISSMTTIKIVLDSLNRI